MTPECENLIEIFEENKNIGPRMSVLFALNINSCKNAQDENLFKLR